MARQRDETGSWLAIALSEPRDFPVLVYVPSKTRDGAALDHTRWRDETVSKMTELFAGATAVPGFGAWRDDERGAAIKSEPVSIVTSYMAESDWNESNATNLATFLRYMGRETLQGEIGLIVDGEYFPIRDFGETS